jgi:hypothetical protein
VYPDSQVDEKKKKKKEKKRKNKKKKEKKQRNERKIGSSEIRVDKYCIMKSLNSRASL